MPHSFLVVLAMLISILPVGIMAVDNITVYVSVVRNGEFTTGKNNETMAYVPVAVNSQTLTINDAFTSLHETYCKDGVKGYETTQMDWGTSVTKFWGVYSTSVSYYNNNLYASSLSDPVEDGDHLVFWFYQDTIGWPDTYTFFDKTTATVACGNTLKLTLNQVGYAEIAPLSDAIVTVEGTEVSDMITDAGGKVSLTFEESATITREEAAVMVARAALLCGMATQMNTLAVRDVLSQFPDYVKASDWARESLAFCYNEEILSDEALDIKPQEQITRAEIASMLYNMLSKSKLL